MKKILIKLIALALAVSMICMIGCNKPLAMGKEMLKCDTQLDAITKVVNDDADAAVIDSIMAGYYASTGDYAGQISIVPNLTLAQEEYGIAGRKK